MIFAGLLLFFFLDYVRPTSFIPALQVLHLNSLVPLGVVLGTIVTRKGRENQITPGDPSNTAMLGTFLGLIVLSTAFADVTERVFNVFVAVLGYVAIYWVLTRQVDSFNRLKSVVKALLLVHLIVAALNPMMFTDPDVRHYVTSGAFLGDGNDFALSVNIVIPLCLFLMSEAKTARHKLFWALALLVCIACVVLTKSRGGTVALACVGLYYWSKSDKKLASGAGAVVVVTLILWLAPPSYFDRMSKITDSQEGSAQGRIQAWWGGIRMALDYPLTGVGAGHFPIAYGTRYRLSSDVPWQTAHSIYFLVLGELGFPGITVLLMIIGRNLVANRRMLRQLKGEDPASVTERRLLAALNASMVAFATGGAFLSGAYYPHLYVIVGLHTAARRIIHQRSRVGAAVTAPKHRVLPVSGAISPEWKQAQFAGQSGLPRAIPERR